MITVSEAKIVKNGEIELASESFGDAQRGTFLLIMGATASMVWWPDSLIERLTAAGYRVIRYDHRDTGQSSSNPLGTINYDVEELVGDAIAILDAYGVGTASLVGMSLGGLIAQIVALRYPARVRSLTLIAAEPVGLDYGAGEFSPDLMKHFGTMEHLDWGDRKQVAEFMLEIARLSAGSQPPFDPVAARARIDAELDHARSMQSAFNHAAMVGSLDPELVANNIVQPSLIIHGTEDPLIRPDAARTSAGAISGARTLWLKGRGHELIEDDMPSIAEAIVALDLGAAAK